MVRKVLKTECIGCQVVNDQLLYTAKLPDDAVDFSARHEKVGHYHHRIVRCENCGLVRSDPIFSVDEISQLYAASLYSYDAQAGFAADTYERLWKKFFCTLPRDASILEVGCGNGFFLSRLKAEGFDEVSGVEPSIDSCQRSEDGLNIHCDMFPSDQLYGLKFDVILNFHVIDHVVNPRVFLESCWDHLNPGGKLLTVCHDQGSLSARILGRFSPIYDIEHVFLFSMDTLKSLQTDVGFSVKASGKLRNTYPLGYWLQYVPWTSYLRQVLPRIMSIPLSLNAGNQFSLAVKDIQTKSCS
jgi:SAM-dependent methyltransferase